MIELMEDAPDFIKNISKEKAPNAKAYATFMYDNHPVERPELLDRTEEMELALCGLTGSTNFTTIDFKKSDLSKYGYRPEGPAYHYAHRIIFA
jgi:hypothetical protein